MGAIRGAARRLGRPSLSGVTVFCMVEPCAMCVGALLQSDADGLGVRAAGPGRRAPAAPASSSPRPRAGRAGCASSAASCAMTPRSCGRTSTCDRADAARPPVADRAPGRGSRGTLAPAKPPARAALCYPLPRRGVRVVDGAALEKRCAKAPWVRIPPSPPSRSLGRTAAGARSHAPERSPSGRGRRTGNAVWGNPSRVRIPPSPPLALDRPSRARSGLSSSGRARRGTSGALYLQSAPAGLNPLPRPAFADAGGASDVEDRVPRSGGA